MIEHDPAKEKRMSEEKLSNVADAATLIPLSRLREHSERLAYDIDKIDWAKGPIARASGSPST